MNSGIICEAKQNRGREFMSEKQLIRDIEENIKLQLSFNMEARNLDSKWRELVSIEPRRFINPDSTIDLEALRNFRRRTIFIPDTPTYTMSYLSLTSLIGGGRRGARRLLGDCLDIIKAHNYEYLLKKYPCSTVGRPHLHEHGGHRFTWRWTKHIYSLGLFQEKLKTRLAPDFTLLDIGSSYGIFSYLLKKEYPASHHILLDFPEQLVLAHYFLGISFPGVKIASFRELAGHERIDRGILKQYDFILLPWYRYKALAAGSVDIVANFASLGEMKREWFDYYLKSEPFLSTKYFFTHNRFQSAPTYDTDLTILDYPLGDFKKLHFGVCPFCLYDYKRKNLFLYEKFYYSSPYFEFIGERDV